MRSYQDMVFATAMRLLANNAEAEDVAQEVFLRAYDRYAELPKVRFLASDMIEHR